MPSVPEQSVKQRGAYFTPNLVAESLVQWAVRSPADDLLDPACGDGQFLQFHPSAYGCELHSPSAVTAIQRTKPKQLLVGDFFEHAEQWKKRFDCVVGNPPFIRYQEFSGTIRERALRLCASQGVTLPALTSSWAPFVVVAASLLKPAGRLAMVVPAEIGHARYAAPLVRHLKSRFARTRVIAVREQIFPDLSQDAWILLAEGYGQAGVLEFSQIESFRQTAISGRGTIISEDQLNFWQGRLRPFLISDDVRARYAELLTQEEAFRLGSIAKCGIGYVTGANDFFHLRPSQAARLNIPEKLLLPSVRNGRQLPNGQITVTHVKAWRKADSANFLLRLTGGEAIPNSVQKYLDSEEGRDAKTTYKCRNRSPWYAVPDVRLPDGFMTYMNGRSVALVKNSAGCTCTNSIHAVQMRKGHAFAELTDGWNSTIRELSAEIEGHPLGGGMLKLEPTEATRLLIPTRQTRLTKSEAEAFRQATSNMQLWRHYSGSADIVDAGD